MSKKTNSCEINNHACPEALDSPDIEDCQIISNNQVGPKLFKLSVSSPTIAKAIKPGQFVNMLIPGMEAHILRRPFSVLDADACEGTLDILYQVVGFGTTQLSTLSSGTTISMIGPLGSVWNPPEDAKKVLLVAGGVGAAPLYMLTKKLATSASVLRVVMGGASDKALVLKDSYDELQNASSACDYQVDYATDDGSLGYKGFNTELVSVAIKEESYDYVAICGPEPMIIKAFALLDKQKSKVEISLERRMACGIGACLSCVVETQNGLKRACVDGPIFLGSEVIFS